MTDRYDHSRGRYRSLEDDEDPELELRARRRPAPGKVSLTSRIQVAGKGDAAVAARGTTAPVQRKPREPDLPVADPFGLHLPDTQPKEGDPDGGIPQPLRQRFEAALDTDLSHIRLHRDGGAAQRVAHHGARAYAQGADIHFGAGEYDPSSSEGQHLIAHEVAHAVQQTGGSAAVRPQFKLAGSQEHDPIEREADQAADAMVRGDRFALSAQPTGIAPTRRVKGRPRRRGCPRFWQRPTPR